MPVIRGVNGIEPVLGNECFVADNATIVGEVICGDRCTFWFNTVVRGDVHSILIGDDTNVQDGAVIHCTYKKFRTVIGSRVSIGHNAIIHGCTLQDDVLVGMGAIVMDGAVVERNSIVAAGAVVLEGTIVESGSVFAGVPAKKVKAMDENLREMIHRTASNYPMYAKWFENEKG